MALSSGHVRQFQFPLASRARAVPGSQRFRTHRYWAINLVTLSESWLLRAQDSSRSRDGLRLHPAPAPRVIEAGQRAEQQVEREENLRLAIHPFREALQEDAANTKENSRAHAIHGPRRALPQKHRTHLKPSNPQQQEKTQPRQTQFAYRQRAEVVRRRGIIELPNLLLLRR